MLTCTSSLPCSQGQTSGNCCLIQGVSAEVSGPLQCVVPIPSGSADSTWGPHGQGTREDAAIPLASSCKTRAVRKFRKGSLGGLVFTLPSGIFSELRIPHLFKGAGVSAILKLGHSHACFWDSPRAEPEAELDEGITCLALGTLHTQSCPALLRMYVPSFSPIIFKINDRVKRGWILNN